MKRIMVVNCDLSSSVIFSHHLTSRKKRGVTNHNEEDEDEEEDETRTTKSPGEEQIWTFVLHCIFNGIYMIVINILIMMMLVTWHD